LFFASANLGESADATDEVAEEEAAAVLASVENEPGRTTDPVRMYTARRRSPVKKSLYSFNTTSTAFGQ
jgi:hypothetical protein